MTEAEFRNPTAVDAANEYDASEIHGKNNLPVKWMDDACPSTFSYQNCNF